MLHKGRALFQSDFKNTSFSNGGLFCSQHICVSDYGYYN